MKGHRSNRVVTNDPPDDWVNSSWTVDCICGVTFDDGEEMVNCDECGVWVHTRCSRFVKGEKSFACDKCKSNRNRTRNRSRSSLITDDEETEVAQLLVDLPTKTIHHHHHHLKMTDSNSNSNSGSQCLRPLWTQRPFEDRVHVQGVPGGDPSLFTSNQFPVLISSHLWKSTGYIPKHFNFRYTEFPCWQSEVPPASKNQNPNQNQNSLRKRSSEDSSKDGSGSANKKVKVFHGDNERKQSKLPSPRTAVNCSTTATLMPIVECKEHESQSNTHLASASNLQKPTPSSPDDSSQTTSIHKSASQLHKSDTTTVNSFPSSNEDVNVGTLAKKERHVLAVNGSQTANSESPNFTSDMPKSKPLIEDLTNAVSEHKNIEKSSIPMASGHCSNETKSDAYFDNPKGVLACYPAVNITSDFFKNVTSYESSPNQEYKGSKLSEAVVNTCKPLEQEEKYNDNGLEAVTGCQFDRNDVIKSEAVPTPPPAHNKIASSTPPAIVFSRSCLSDKTRSGDSQNPSFVGKILMSNSSMNTKKEDAPVNVVNEDTHDKPINGLKDNSKPSKTVLKCYSSVGKDSLRHSSSKVSPIDSSSVSSSVSEPAGALQSEHGLHGQNKNVGSGCQQRVEKVSQSNLPTSSKSNQPSIGHPIASSNPPAGLSDEELALLLHQELNSSPRVPRVPRVRQAGNLPQLSSASGANTLMKRTTNSGLKDRNTFSRRRNRDTLKDESRDSREQDPESSKVDRVPSSPDSLRKSEAFSQTEHNTDSKPKRNREKILSSASPARINSPEDDVGASRNFDLTYHTLPGLIAEIMGAGRRMTYEELCNAVLPHWPNLRKHNGERYAYSSHFQAVLDCLRNRTEWARLVDRGPKTSSSWKKRKIDAEPLSCESEDKDGESKSYESNKEEFRKGRRKARKRRGGVGQQGRNGVKEGGGQKRRKVEVGSSSDSGSLSNSSEDTVSCQDDDSQGSEMDASNTEESASSHEDRAML